MTMGQLTRPTTDQLASKVASLFCVFAVARLRGRLNLLRLFRGVFHAVAKRADTLTETLPQFRELLGAENKQRDDQNDQQVTRLQEIFNHEGSPGEWWASGAYRPKYIRSW